MNIEMLRGIPGRNEIRATSKMTSPGTVYIPPSDGTGTTFRVLRDPVEVLCADSVGDVDAVLQKTMRAVRSGMRAAGWIAYEAAPAMDAALAVRPDCPVPLAWFGIYRRVERAPCNELAKSAGPFELGQWKPSISRHRYRQDIDRIRLALQAGQTYQVNHSLRLKAGFQGDPAALFLALYRAQPSPYAMYVDAGEFVLASASPELFVRRRGASLTSRPMKGTAQRGRDEIANARRAQRLQASEKDRSENIMIVDMIRNDMGRVALPGSVRARRLCRLESYPTVFQMTSTVTARTCAQWPAVMRAMFPCASVTGAPKVSTMALIRELETAPRGVYTGCMGYISRPNVYQFNVAIRTVTVDRRRQIAEYGIGGGIVWESRADREYRECLAKAALLDNLAGDLPDCIPDAALSD